MLQSDVKVCRVAKRRAKLIQQLEEQFLGTVLLDCPKCGLTFNAAQSLRTLLKWYRTRRTRRARVRMETKK